VVISGSGDGAGDQRRPVLDGRFVERHRALEWGGAAGDGSWGGAGGRGREGARWLRLGGAEGFDLGAGRDSQWRYRPS
jgi:hypothetical protein